MITAKIRWNDDLCINTVANAHYGAGFSVKVDRISKPQRTDCRNDLFVELCSAMMTELTHKSGFSCIGIIGSWLSDNRLLFHHPFPCKMLQKSCISDLFFATGAKTRFLSLCGASGILCDLPLAKGVDVFDYRGLAPLRRCAFVWDGATGCFGESNIENPRNQNTQASRKRPPFDPSATCMVILRWIRIKDQLRVNITQSPKKHFSTHLTNPSFLKKSFSFCLVRNISIATAFSFIP